MDGDTRCINVSITDDVELEGDESFNVSLMVTFGEIIVGNTMTTITIIDDEGLQSRKTSFWSSLVSLFRFSSHLRATLNECF